MNFLFTRHRAPHIFTRLEEDETIEGTMQVANRMAEGTVDNINTPFPP